MSAFRPPSGPAGRGSRTETPMSVSSASESNRRERRKSFSGPSKRMSEGRHTPMTGVPVVNKIIGEFEQKYEQTPRGGRPMLIANIQSQLNNHESEIQNALDKAQTALKDLKSKPKSLVSDIKMQQNKVKLMKEKLYRAKNASKQWTSVLAKRGGRSGNEPILKRTKSTDNPPFILPGPSPRKNLKKPTPQKGKSILPRLVEEPKMSLKNALEQRFKQVKIGKETVIETKASSPTDAHFNLMSKAAKATKVANTEPSTPIGAKISPTIPRDTKMMHTQAKTKPKPISVSNVATEAANAIRNRGIGTENHFKRMSEAAKSVGVKNDRTPPRIEPRRVRRQLFKNFEDEYEKTRQLIKTTKKQSNVERKLELKDYITKADFNKLMKKLDKPGTPVKQQLTKNNIAELIKPLLAKKQVKFSLFGSLGDLDKKKILTRKPESIAKAFANKFKKEFVQRMKTPRSKPRSQVKTSVYTRTPTTGQRKKHVIELIDRVLKRMKVPKDLEKRVIEFYEALSEKYIKQTFGGKTKEDVKTIIKNQVEYLSKKR